METNYSVHDIIKFKIVANKISSRMAIEYKNFEQRGASAITVFEGNKNAGIY